MSVLKVGVQQEILLRTQLPTVQQRFVLQVAREEIYLILLERHTNLQNVLTKESAIEQLESASVPMDLRAQLVNG